MESPTVLKYTYLTPSMKRPLAAMSLGLAKAPISFLTSSPEIYTGRAIKIIQGLMSVTEAVNMIHSRRGLGPHASCHCPERVSIKIQFHRDPSQEFHQRVLSFNLTDRSPPLEWREVGPDSNI